MHAFLFASIFTEDLNGMTVLRATSPLMAGILCILAIAYRYYSAFLAARVACLDDSRITPAHQYNDGQNYHPTNRWVLFGHHFAAISGAGPLIGPVLAIQYGYMPGLLWLVIGVCLAGAVQDMLVLAASVRRGGKSLAQIALTELGPFAAVLTSVAILFIVVIALAGLGLVVVKALGGEEVKLPKGMEITTPDGTTAKNWRGNSSAFMTGHGKRHRAAGHGGDLRAPRRIAGFATSKMGPETFDPNRSGFRYRTATRSAMGQLSGRSSTHFHPKEGDTSFRKGRFNSSPAPPGAPSPSR